MRKWTVLLLPTLLLLLTGGVLPAAGRRRKRRASEQGREPSPPPPSAAELKAMSHHQRGVMAHVQGDPAGAKAAFRRAIGAKPDFAYAYYRLGFVLHEEEQVVQHDARQLSSPKHMT